jgi:hypothetical protein
MLRPASEIRYAWAPALADGHLPAYAGAGYQSLLASNDCSEPVVLACGDPGAAAAFLPLLVRDLGSGAKEAYSAYGYGGWFGGEVALSAPDVERLKAHLADAGIVALFIRHAPFVDNRRAWPEGLATLNRHTYAVELNPAPSFEEGLARVPQKLRWSANFALRAGLRVSFHPLTECPEEKIKAFYAQYRELMEQKGTAGYYLFSERFFLDHALRLGAGCELAEVTDEQGRFLGGAFFLLDGSGWVHYHLSAARKEAMKLQGMELLMLSAVHRYGSQGYRSLHLGGGHSLDENDGLSRFKSKFSTRKLDFFCSTLVCDEAAYQRERAARPLSNPSFFLISDARGH